MGPHHLEGVTRYQFDSAHRLLAAYYVKSSGFGNMANGCRMMRLKQLLRNNQTISQPLAARRLGISR